MNAWAGLVPAAGRFALAAALAAAALSLLARALLGTKGRRREARAPRPGRRGITELAALLSRAQDRPYSRDLAAERLRALARDLVALRLGSGDAAARAVLDEAAAQAALEAARAAEGARAAGGGAAGAGASEGPARGGGLDPRLLAFLAEDHFARPAARASRGARASPDGADRRGYLERLEEALGLLEDYGEGRQGERP